MKYLKRFEDAEFFTSQHDDYIEIDTAKMKEELAVYACSLC